VCFGRTPPEQPQEFAEGEQVRGQVESRAGAAALPERAAPASAGDRQSPIRRHRYGVYRYFLIAGLLTFARVTMAEPVP
jgi:hypothetical protein